ncbi:VOC family protein [Deinococcus cellulosilyticus]|uniref:Lactoylglutathione lyase n=1 Tax=Deinococcus cellulosilyticus (strain DSM 18568 / NBRC 106333 / KACC 11606 / 5516J-15) TaxID=1223518 RepID=A0A511N3W1_DEIC1|nr:VOC family protein [Deinococcus cellulosilyticus]GEM47071.1 lactoylglutathione lyase [Deinococcus cellulosilyticus NBRC 106333 = KACC 11606]
MLKHVSFITQSADQIIEFYLLLGAQVLKDETRPEEALRRLVLQFPGGTLQFFQPSVPPEKKQSNWMEHIAFVVEDFDALHDTLKAQGVTFTREKTRSPGGKRMFFVLDPDDRQLEILESSGRMMRTSVER